MFLLFFLFFLFNTRLDFFAELYVKDVTSGATANQGKPSILKETAASALVNGNNLLGPVVGRFCMDLAIEKAKTAGIGWVSTRGSNHFGIAGWYGIRAVEQGMLGMAFTNTSPMLVPTRGKKARILYALLLLRMTVIALY